MFLMNAVIAVFSSLSVRGLSRYTADFAAQAHGNFPNALYVKTIILNVILIYKRKISFKTSNKTGILLATKRDRNE
jgi:hypothetical protein